MNVTALVTTAGAVVERYEYTPYGEATVMEADWSAVSNGQNKSDYDNQLLYRGYRHDPETGLYHARHRFYHAPLGRWINRDPAGYQDGMNLYGAYFVPGGWDPWGLRTVAELEREWKRLNDEKAALYQKLDGMEFDRWNRPLHVEEIDRQVDAIREQLNKLRQEYNEALAAGAKPVPPPKSIDEKVQAAAVEASWRAAAAMERAEEAVDKEWTDYKRSAGPAFVEGFKVVIDAIYYGPDECFYVSRHETERAFDVVWNGSELPDDLGPTHAARVEAATQATRLVIRPATEAIVTSNEWIPSAASDAWCFTKDATYGRYQSFSTGSYNWQTQFFQGKQIVSQRDGIIPCMWGEFSGFMDWVTEPIVEFIVANRDLDMDDPASYRACGDAYVKSGVAGLEVAASLRALRVDIDVDAVARVAPKSAVAGEGFSVSRLPGEQGMRVPRRLTPAEMEALTKQHGVEFSLVYRTGPGKAGGGGFYELYSGTKNSVRVPIAKDVRWISHTHPGGTSFPSPADKNVLDLLRKVTPQRSSTVVPVGKQPVRFKAGG